LLTLTGATTPASYPYTGGGSVWPYTYASSSGQLTLSQSGVQQLTDSAGTMTHGTAIVNASSVIYVLDNEAITTASNAEIPSYSSPSQILPYTIGTGGSLQAEPSGIIPDDSTLANPIYVLVESKGKFVYVANQGNNITGNNKNSGIAGYFLTTAPSYQLTFVSGEPFGSANEYDSTVTGRLLDPDSGELDNLRVTSTYTLQGPPTWCLMDGRTS
jgi:hypothetical protein